VCLLILAFPGCTSGTVQQQGQGNMTQQKGNMMGGNLQGRAPISGTNSGVTPGATPGGKTGIIPTPGVGILGKKNMEPLSRQLSLSLQKADNILSRLGKIDGANQINAVVKGNTCIIGYTPAVMTKNGNNTKSMIVSKVKQIDGTITNVVVSDSANISARVKKLSDSIKANKAVSEVETEFNKLLQTIKPSGK
jgi:hypothetical protein